MLQSLNSIIWPCLIVRHGRHDRHDRSWFDRAPFTSKAGTVVPVRAYSDSRPQPCVPVRATVPGFPSGRHDRSGTWHDRVNHWGERSWRTGSPLKDQTGDLFKLNFPKLFLR